MAEVSVDRLALRVPGLSEHEAARLARLVAEDLAAAVEPESVRRVATLRVSVRPGPGESLDRLAKQIVAELLRQLEREA
jgi:hypothetical protein